MADNAKMFPQASILIFRALLLQELARTEIYDLSNQIKRSVKTYTRQTNHICKPRTSSCLIPQPGALRQHHAATSVCFNNVKPIEFICPSSHELRNVITFVVLTPLSQNKQHRHLNDPLQTWTRTKYIPANVLEKSKTRKNNFPHATETTTSQTYVCLLPSTCTMFRVDEI